MAPASSLLIDEHFEAGDPRFLDEVLASAAARKLKALADRLVRGRRGPSRARRCSATSTTAATGRTTARWSRRSSSSRRWPADDEAMGHFLVAFDRLVRRRLKAKSRWEPEKKVFRHDPTVPLVLGLGEVREPRFSRRTRLYLVRRAFRYFRAVARKDETRYGQSLRAALVLYEDRHLELAEQLLDSWGLVHALYWGSPVLVRDPRGIRLAEGRALAELAPAPFAPEAWQGALHGVLDLVVRARGAGRCGSSPSRLLRRDYADALRGMPLAAGARAAALAARGGPGLRRRGPQGPREARASSPWTSGSSCWPSTTRRRCPCSASMVQKVVSPERLSLAQCVQLACARAAPVAELGLGWARRKRVDDEAALVAVLGLAHAGVAARARGGRGVGRLESSARPRSPGPEHVRELLDARFAEPRAAALALVEKRPALPREHRALGRARRVALRRRARGAGAAPRRAREDLRAGDAAARVGDRAARGAPRRAGQARRRSTRSQTASRAGRPRRRRSCRSSPSPSAACARPSGAPRWRPWRGAALREPGLRAAIAAGAARAEAAPGSVAA